MFLRLLVSLLAGHIPGGCEERGQVAGFSYAKMPLTSEYPQRRREHHTNLVPLLLASCLLDRSLRH